MAAIIFVIGLLIFLANEASPYKLQVLIPGRKGGQLSASTFAYRQEIYTRPQNNWPAEINSTAT